MVLVVALPELAREIGELIEGPKSYVVAVKDAKELRHKVYDAQPAIVILDYRIGGSAWRAVDEIAAIASRTASQPYVIAVVPWLNRKVAQEAADADCYNMVVFNEKRRKTFGADLVSAVQVAHQARKAAAVEPRRLRRGDLH